MKIRQARLLIRDKKTTGGALPAGALMAEPFVNLYDGILKFSGVTGGGFEPSDVTSVFEVGSTLYNSKIINRLNINDNFIISGDTGRISTYDGIAASGFGGKFLSGTTSGFVLGNISDIQGVIDITRVQGGTNISTGGTANTPIINLDNDIVLNSVEAISVSATTGGFYSGGTNLETIISNIVGTHTTVTAGSNILVTGTASNPIVNLTASPFVDTLNASGSVITNGTTYSGGTIQDDGIFTIDAATQVEVDSDLLPTAHLTYDLGAVGQRWNKVFAKRIRLGTSSTILEDNLFSSTTGNFLFDFAGDLSVDNNILPNADISYDLGTSGSRWKAIYGQDLNLSGEMTVTGLTDSSLTAGRVVYAGTGGKLSDEAGFEYDAGANLLKTPSIQIGDPTTTGVTTTTIFGDVVIVGDAFSSITSQLYIEDNLIELNFNPSASTTSASLGAGWSIQDGSGTAGIDVLWDVRGTATGLANRSFATNLEDIRIRESGTVSSPNGVRVIAEGDIVDGGSY